MKTQRARLRGAKVALWQLWNDDSGQDLVEYSLLLAFIALAAVGLLSGSRTTVSKLWSTINNTLASASTTVS